MAHNRTYTFPMGLITILSAMALSTPAAIPTPMSFYDFKMNSIEGKELPLAKFKGKVVMVVNVASKCGLTPQYEALEKLYKAKKDDGLVILGFPANEFGNQEPGSNKEILEFCTAKYGVTFPMFSKIVVKGEAIHPLYKWLLDKTDGKDIEWNFAKFLVSKDGEKVIRFSSRTKPDAAEVLTAIDQAIKG